MENSGPYSVGSGNRQKQCGVAMTLIRVAIEHGVSRDRSLVLYNESSDSLWESLLRGFQKINGNYILIYTEHTKVNKDVTFV